MFAEALHFIVKPQRSVGLNLWILWYRAAISGVTIGFPGVE